MQLKNLAYSAAAFSVLAALPTVGHAAAVVPNLSVSGVPAPGFPHFDESKDVSVTLVKSGSGATATYQLTATYNVGGPFLFQYDPWTSFNITGATYQLVANFNNSAGLTGGTVTINGTIPGYAVPGTTAPASPLLYKADLLGYSKDTTAETTSDPTPMALAFKTGNTDPASWAYQFQKTGIESVYLYDFNVAALMGSFTSSKFKSVQFTNASALTTVPLPAALWLFGSAVAALAGTRRRVAVSR
jgi:hypothetical protein